VVTALAQEEITPEAGGEVIFDIEGGGTVEIQIPTGAVAEQVTIQVTTNPNVTTPGGLVLLGDSFTITALLDGVPLDSFVFVEPVEVRVDYTDGQIEGIEESILKLYVWDVDLKAWADAAQTCNPPSEYTRNLNENWFSTGVCHLSQFAVFGEVEQEGNSLFLPVLRTP